MLTNRKSSRRALRYAVALFMCTIVVAGALSFFRNSEPSKGQPAPHALQQSP